MKHQPWLSKRVALAIALVVAGCSTDPTGGSNTTNNPPSTPTPTAVGTVSGSAATVTIGTAGGSLTSVDGLLTLTIPAGALSANTSISIQPITNMAWGGTGNGYRLSPNGLTFTTPVTLQFQVPAGAIDGSAPEFVKVATQGSDGTWFVLKDRVYDEESRTLTTHTKHFSDYSTVLGLQIRPATAAVDFQGSVLVKVDYCYDAAAATDPELVSLVYTCDDGGGDPIAPLGTFSNWSVNGVVGGNGASGNIVPTGGGQQATFHAPAVTPPGNPVIVSVQASIGGVTKVLQASITIGSSWEGDGVWFDPAGTGNLNDGNHINFHAIWTLSGAYNGVEIYTAAGGANVSLYSDPTCPEISLVPSSGRLMSGQAGGQMIINRTTSTVAIVTIAADWMARRTTQCHGEAAETQQLEVILGLGAETGLQLSADGKTITGTHLDEETGASYSFNFQRKVP